LGKARAETMDGIDQPVATSVLAKPTIYVRFCAIAQNEVRILAIAPSEILSHDLTK
jgi:hypothetical protein